MTDPADAARDVIDHEIDDWTVDYFGMGRSKWTEYLRNSIIAALTAADYQITRRDPAAGRVCVSVETARFIKRELNRLSDHEQFEDADVAEQHRRELEDAITEAAAPDPGSAEQQGG